MLYALNGMLTLDSPQGRHIPATAAGDLLLPRKGSQMADSARRPMGRQQRMAEGISRGSVCHRVWPLDVGVSRCTSSRHDADLIK
jgi:hypothetical protein